MFRSLEPSTCYLSWIAGPRYPSPAVARSRPRLRVMPDVAVLPADTLLREGIKPTRQRPD